MWLLTLNSCKSAVDVRRFLFLRSRQPVVSLTWVRLNETSDCIHDVFIYSLRTRKPQRFQGESLQSSRSNHSILASKSRLCPVNPYSTFSQSKETSHRLNLCITVNLVANSIIEIMLSFRHNWCLIRNPSFIFDTHTLAITLLRLRRVFPVESWFTLCNHNAFRRVFIWEADRGYSKLKSCALLPPPFPTPRFRFKGPSRWPAIRLPWTSKCQITKGSVALRLLCTMPFQNSKKVVHSLSKKGATVQ